MNPEHIFESEQLTPEQIGWLQEQQMSGVMRLNNFSMSVRSVDDRRAEVNLTSAGVWILVLGAETGLEDRVLFVEQADRRLPNGKHPWEIPSGGVDPTQDANIGATCAREAREETGFNLPFLQPIALAIRRPGVEMVPEDYFSLTGKGQDALWVDDNALWSSDQPTGGLIYFSAINMRHLPLPLVQMLCRRSPNDTVLMDPPAGVNRQEIGQIALVPLRKLLSGSSELLFESAHMWAMTDGFRAFVAGFEEG